MFSQLIMKDSQLFGIPIQSSPFRIPVLILNRNDFNIQLEKTPLTRFGATDCLAFSTSCIYVLSYQQLYSNVRRTHYLKAIRHECIHLLQHLTSKVPPHEMIWLYESVACTIAKQHQRFPINPPTWVNFTRNFYANTDCYSTAYHFGKALLEIYPLCDLIALSVRKKDCLQASRRIYKMTFNK